MRSLGRLATMPVLAVCVLALSGCSAFSRGIVVLDDGGYRLEAVAGCDIRFTEVTVEYWPQWKLVWSVTFAADSYPESVVLFEPAPWAVDEHRAGNVDLGHEVVIAWKEDNGTMGSVPGVLADLQPGQVIWDGGLEDAEKFAKIPKRDFSC